MIDLYRELPEQVHTYAHSYDPDHKDYKDQPRVLKEIHPVDEGALVVITRHVAGRRMYSVHLCSDMGDVYDVTMGGYKTPKGAHDRCRMERWRWNRSRYEELLSTP